MALSKETLCPVTSELTFVRNESANEGTSIVYYFQSGEYIDQYGLELGCEEVLAEVDEQELITTFVGNIKFTLPADAIQKKRYASLRDLQPGTKTVVRFGISPQAMAVERGAVKYASTKFIKAYGDWTEFFKALKAEGKLNTTAAATAQ